MNLSIFCVMICTAIPTAHMAALKESREDNSDRTSRQALAPTLFGGTIGALLGNLASPLESQLQNAGTMLISSGVNQLGLNNGGSTFLTNTLSQLFQGFLARDAVQSSLGQYRISAFTGPGNQPLLILNPISPNIKPIVLPLQIRDILNVNHGYNNIGNGHIGLDHIFNNHGFNHNLQPHTSHLIHNNHGGHHNHLNSDKIHATKPDHLKKPEEFDHTKTVEAGTFHDNSYKKADQRPLVSEEALNNALGKSSDSTEELEQFYPEIHQF